MQVHDVETPALVVDLDRLGANVERLASATGSRGLALRPHAKTHKSVEIARLQQRAGAVGLTVATLAEAEVFAAAGLTDLFVAYPVYPRAAVVDRFRRLLESAVLTVGVDNIEGARAVARAASGRLVRVLVEVDSGQARTGVTPDAAPPLAEACAALGLDVAGVFSHGGHAYAGPAARSRATADEGAALVAAADGLRAAGFDVRTVSAGSTPTSGGDRPAAVTEERPGTYVFGDRQQVTLGAARPDQVALSVAATVVSSGPDRFVVDAGSKVLAGDRPDWLEGFAAVPALGDAPVTRLSEHHGVVDRNGGSWPRPRVGEVVLLTPNHACTVANLATEYLVVRQGEVVDRWPVDARGRNT